MKKNVQTMTSRQMVEVDDDDDVNTTKVWSEVGPRVKQNNNGD